MMGAPAAVIPHAARCSRPSPMLRTSWRGEPEAWCPSCGRAGVADGKQQLDRSRAV
jgi:hypothetical protein